MLSRIRQYLEVTEENFLDRLLNFALWNYDDVITKAIPEYPYTINDDNEERRYSQVSIWFACKQVNPRTGTTILDEFVERFVDDGDLAPKLLQAKEMAYDRFVVLHMDAKTITAASTSGGGMYRIRLLPEIEALEEGSFFTGLMHPWDADGTHTMCGEVFIEPVTVLSRPGGRIYGIHSMIRDCPQDSIISMCACLNIDHAGMSMTEKARAVSSLLLSDRLRAIVQGLPNDERECLRQVVELGGTARHLDLGNRFGTPGNPAESAIDRLEDKALLVPGLMEKNGAVTPAVIIAGDILANIYRLGCLVSR